jgi:hypothetical protein
MTKFIQKYTIIQLLEDIDDGYEFSSSNWPLHTTIVDTFAIEWDKDKLINGLESLLTKRKAITTQASKFEFFGPKREIKLFSLREIKRFGNFIIV